VALADPAQEVGHAVRKACIQRAEEGLLGTEPLDDRTRRDPRFSADLGQREFGRGHALHRAHQRLEDLVVGHLAWSGTHGVRTRGA
jgi:hypothetical protein